LLEFFANALLLVSIISTPLEEIFITGPNPSIKLIYFPQNYELTDRILQFARSRPYSMEIQQWWNGHSVSTDFIAKTVQELEYEYKKLPDPIDSDRFLITNQQIYDRINEWDEYRLELKTDFQYRLKEEQDFIEELIKQVEKYADGYRNLVYSRESAYGEIVKRRYLAEVKNKIGERFYNEGVLPRLIPDVVKNFP
jgi:hypothetical protein